MFTNFGAVLPVNNTLVHRVGLASRLTIVSLDSVSGVASNFANLCACVSQ